MAKGAKVSEIEEKTFLTKDSKLTKELENTNKLGKYTHEIRRYSYRLHFSDKY